MAYRIHFTARDLARTRVANAAMPFLELDSAIRALQSRSQAARLDSWRRTARARLTDEARMALALIPAIGYSPTFLTPPRAGSAEEILEIVRATPRGDVRAELAEIAERQPVPSWAHRLGDDPELFARLSDGIGGLYAILVEPYWTPITDLFRADRAIRQRQLLEGGIERVLSQANPRWMRWKPPVLEIGMPREIEQDLYLEGQGVVLTPSVFQTRTLVDDEAVPQPTVSYPVGLDQPLHCLTVVTPRTPAARSMSAVAALMGHTRSAVLSAIAERPGCSTSELAAIAGIAPASASEHATVLRNAGLIRSARHRNTMLHNITSLGIALLDSPPHGS